MSESILSGEVLFLLRRSFAGADQARAIEILEDYARKYAKLGDLFRVQCDMIRVALGDLSKLDKIAKMDYRDIILEAEYQLRDGRLVPRDTPVE